MLYSRDPIIEALPNPECCGDSEKIRLHYEGLAYTYGITKEEYLKTKPVWSIMAPSGLYYSLKFCPFCGKELPDIQLKEELPEVCVCTDGGYYCDTCEQRLRACQCKPSEYLWEIKRQ